MLPGISLPKQNSIDKLIPGYNKRYNPMYIINHESYIHTMDDHFKQRRDFLEEAHHKEGADIFIDLIKALKPKLPKIEYSDINGAPGISPPQHGIDTEAE